MTHQESRSRGMTLGDLFLGVTWLMYYGFRYEPYFNRYSCRAFKLQHCSGTWLLLVWAALDERAAGVHTWSLGLWVLEFEQTQNPSPLFPSCMTLGK